MYLQVGDGQTIHAVPCHREVIVAFTYVPTTEDMG